MEVNGVWGGGGGGGGGGSRMLTKHARGARSWLVARLSRILKSNLPLRPPFSTPASPSFRSPTRPLARRLTGPPVLPLARPPANRTAGSSARSPGHLPVLPPVLSFPGHPARPPSRPPALPHLPPARLLAANRPPALSLARFTSDQPTFLPATVYSFEVQFYCVAPCAHWDGAATESASRLSPV